ncbi:PREDICTED: uncharacterized protein LOC109593770 [Amphimedon queenslandica]|uniref:Calx-beta domain-containing protein n=1 Tax=Amphimedon queenslandica TaxID=400682 RepID=A0AAN0K533_AMPQE|nr:PREDICTED: uncharacterized protein LOC109593770 [Amphimedon queenslandica]|eukprot:XP_019864416.1 PREDICTED: uncharacterized protein LOC109593770 [Amphimedon queenslandica]
MTAFLYLCIVLQLLHLTVAIVSTAPTVSFESSSTVITEGTSAEVCLTITGTVFVPITVTLTATPGTADASDYTASTAVIVNPGDSRVCATVTAIQDNVDEPDETIIYAVHSGSGYTAGGIMYHLLTITPPPPCPCKDRIATLACKYMENNGEYLPMPCRELLENNP